MYLKRKKSFSESISNVFLYPLLTVFVIAMAWGWVLNVKAVWYATSIDGETMVRIVAIFLWPIGCIIGWL